MDECKGKREIGEGPLVPRTSDSKRAETSLPDAGVAAPNMELVLRTTMKIFQNLIPQSCLLLVKYSLIRSEIRDRYLFLILFWRMNSCIQILFFQINIGFHLLSEYVKRYATLPHCRLILGPGTRTGTPSQY